MSVVTTPDGTQLFFNDWGQGAPVVLIHGWPLTSDMWSDQAMALAEAGHRVITYDRRGFGRSGQPWEGYDYDTLASDLDVLMTTLDLRGATLVGFSMGGGEVARYLSRFGAARVAKAVLVGAVTPFLLQTPDNPGGVPRSVFDDMRAKLREDRAAFLQDFAPGFYGNAFLDGKVSGAVLDWTFQMAMTGSLRATLACVTAFSETDFRPDMAAFTMPTLIVHGTKDATVPMEKSGARTAAMIPHATFLPFEGQGHGLPASAKQRLTEDLLAFLAT